MCLPVLPGLSARRVAHHQTKAAPTLDPRPTRGPRPFFLSSAKGVRPQDWILDNTHTPVLFYCLESAPVAFRFRAAMAPRVRVGWRWSTGQSVGSSAKKKECTGYWTLDRGLGPGGFPVGKDPHLFGRVVKTLQVKVGFESSRVGSRQGSWICKSLLCC